MDFIKKRGLGMFVSSDAKEIILVRRKNQTLKRLVIDWVLEANRLNVLEDELIEMIKLAKSDNKGEGGRMNKTRMSYDQGRDQWFVNLDGREYGLHCGESFELYIGSNPLPCHLELASKWYVIIENTRFVLQEHDQYMINL